MELVGTTGPRLRTLVASEVSGLVAELPVEEGDAVTRGRILCKLRDLPRRIAHDEAVAEQGRLAAVVKEREAEFVKAAFDKQRVARLWEKEQGSEKERIETQANFDMASGRVEQAKHDLEGQNAVVARLADDLERTVIRSPCDGYVVSKQTEIGSWLPQGGGVVELIDLSTVRVRVRVPEAIIAFCAVGAEVVVSVDALGRRYQAKITRVVPEAHERARTFPVDIDIPNTSGELKSGMLARVAVPAGRGAVRPVVPKDAVVRRGPGQIVFVVRKTDDGDMAVPLPIVIVSELRDYVAVEAAGLEAGDRVIVRGNEMMFAPGPVIAVPRQEPTTSQPVEPAEGQGPSQQRTATTG